MGFEVLDTGLSAEMKLLLAILIGVTLILLSHLVGNFRIKKEYSTSERLLLDEETLDQRTARDIRTVTEHFIGSIQEGRKWYTDGRTLGHELEFHWDHRKRNVKDVKSLTLHQRKVLVSNPCVFFSEFRCSGQMDLIMGATAKYS